MTSERIRVAVVFGGRSGEHPVSCISAAGVLANIDTDAFDVTAIGITPEGSWLRMDPAAIPAAAGRELPKVSHGSAVALPADPTAAAMVSLVPGDAGRPARWTWTSCSPSCTARTARTAPFRACWSWPACPMSAPGCWHRRRPWTRSSPRNCWPPRGCRSASGRYCGRASRPCSESERNRLGLPVFVKPARAGSSLGVSRVDSWAELDRAIDHARQTDPKVLVEAAVLGREIECGVLEYPDGRIEASPTAEIHVGGDHDFYDFDAKYLDDAAATFDIPAVLSEDVTARIQDLSRRAFAALDAQGLARVDFFVRPDGEVVINEVNTLPGFTPISMYPRMWGAGGISYSELITVLIRTALARGTGLR